MNAQLEIPGFELKPTIALVRGDAYLAQCRYCGVVIYVPGGIDRAALPMRELDPCPACCRDRAHGGGWARITYDETATFRRLP